MSQVPTKQIELPAEQADRIAADAKAHGMSVAAYVAYLMQNMKSRVDPRINAATRFMFTKHSDSLKKLAQ